MRVNTGLVLAAALILSGCNFLPKDEAALGQRYFNELCEGHLDSIERNLDPDLKSQQTHLALQHLSTTCPEKSAKKVKVVTWNVTANSDFATHSGSTIYDFTYEYDFSYTRALVFIRLKKTGGVSEIEGLRAVPLTKSLEQRNAFSLSGKTPVEYAFLALAMLIPAFTIGTLIACIRTPIPKRKWLWLIFVSLGLVSLKLNWATGQINVGFLYVVLFGAGYSQQLYGPVILQIGIPVGAILFWLGRTEWYPQPSDQKTDASDPIQV